ncbi:MAG: 4-hydroxy-tetrahydrodipicolinate reductase [Gemmatimonadales bacterium]
MSDRGKLRIAVIGQGRMGRAVVTEATGRGHEIVATVGGSSNRDLQGLTLPGLGGADVAIEFTTPDAAPAVVGRLVELGVAVVSGTTGWADGLATVQGVVERRGGAFLHASNFSVGAHLLFQAARHLGQALAARPELDAAIFESHHTKKVDAPSGTALTLQRYLRTADPGRSYPITSERLGSNPGLHRLTVDGRYETLELTHAVRDRAVFAEGAVLAAEWLAGRRGVFGFESVLFGGDS